MAVLDWILLKSEAWHSTIGLILIAVFLVTLSAAIYMSWTAYQERITPRK